MMDRQEQCHAEVADIRLLTHEVKEICLKLIHPPSLTFTAGQSISVEVTEVPEVKDGHPRLNRRTYSIASAPEEDRAVLLCANLVRSGPGSTHLHGLRSGDAVQFLPPMGFFTVDESATTALLFVATGTGIAPIQSMIRHLLFSGSLRPITLLWGLRHERDLYYQDAFEALARRHPNFCFTTTLSQPSHSWSGARGRVTHILEALPLADNLDVYLCGNSGMIKEARAVLTQKGMPKKSIHYERFF
jgi:ferredoxin-NADP reductase